MKIIKFDLKHEMIVVKIESNDDLWYLKNIVEIGDQIKARTLRSLFIERDGQKLKTGKKPMVLRLEVEKTEFNESLFRLRLSGKILEGPEDVQLGSYHTIETEIGSILTIIKNEWRKYQVEKIKKSQKLVPRICLVVVDNDEATFGVVNGSGLRIVSDLRNQYSIQHEEEKTPEFYKSVAKEMDDLSKDSKKIILAGPGFAKEHVQKIIKNNYPSVNEKLIIDSTSSATRSGITELLKRGNLDRIIQESEIIRESKLVEEFFSHLKKDDGLGIYGLEKIQEVDNIGAIEILLVSDQKIKDKNMEKLANSVESKSGRVEIISTNHESGEQFHRMGGLGAILRFKLY